jgi:hypothetical protein
MYCTYQFIVQLLVIEKQHITGGRGWGNLVSITTGYRLDGPEIESG